MHLRFWGTRGSIATPGPTTIHYGGNTSCVELTTGAGAKLIFDCGTGSRPLGAELVATATGAITASLLLGHTHWDHIQGFPFFAPAFVPGSKIDVYAPEGGQHSLQDILAGQMEFAYFPVELKQLPATINYHDLAEGTHTIGGAKIITQYLNHPAVTLGYRIECDGAVVVYITDHEPFAATLWRSGAEPGQIDSILHEGDRRHAKFMADADLVIHDAQYTPEEYGAKKNWGHSPFDYVVEMAAAAGVRRLALTHHDPGHNDAFLKELEENARAIARRCGSDLDVFCAYEGYTAVIESDIERQPKSVPTIVRHDVIPSKLRLLVVDDDDVLRLMTKSVLERQGYIVSEGANGEEALQLISKEIPDLLVLDFMMPQLNGIEVLKRLHADPKTAGIPVLMLTGMDDEKSIRQAFDAGATDYLAKPFTSPQLTARVRACLTRAAKNV
ncbi:MAG: response regulator [Pyrinomonadaceae bacterium]